MKSALRVLMFLGYYRPHISGLTLYVERLAEALTARGHHVTVLCSHHERHTPYDERVRGVHVRRSPVAVRIRKGAVMPLFWWDVWRLLRHHDLLHLHLPLFEAWPSAWLARRLRRPVLITYHCDIQLPPGRLNRLIEQALAWEQYRAGRLADRIVTYTEDYALHSPFLRRFPTKSAVVYPPILIGEPDAAAAAQWKRDLGLASKTVLGFAARFAADKGPDVLLRALPAVARAVPNVHLVFAGEYQRVLGESVYARCQPLIATQADRLTFLGQIPPERMPEFYRMCDVTVVPSINSTESFGMWQVESMLCGTPVVTTDLPGVRQVVRATGMGELVPPGDSDALAAALIRVLRERSRYWRPAGPLRHHFALETPVARYEMWYRELLGLRVAAAPAAADPQTSR